MMESIDIKRFIYAIDAYASSFSGLFPNRVSESDFHPKYRKIAIMPLGLVTKYQFLYDFHFRILINI